MTVKENSIRDRFFDMDLPQQVAIYSEAIVYEKYELLAVLKNLIPTKYKRVFPKMVEDYRIGKYGK